MDYYYIPMMFKILLIILYLYFGSILISQVFSLHTTADEGCKEIQNENDMIKAEYNKLKLVIRKFDIGKY